MNETGGPSRWWFDESIEHLQQVLRKSDMTTQMQNNLIEKMADQPAEVMQRFIAFTQSTKIKTNFETEESMLESFRRHETRLKCLSTFLKVFVGVIATGAFALGINGLTIWPPSQPAIIELSIALLFGCFSYYLIYVKREMSFYTPGPIHFGPDGL
jgi:hypothetical protein